MTERLKKCIEAGGVVNLFPLLKDWTKEELAALCADIDDYHGEQAKAIDEKWKLDAFKTNNFFSKRNSTALDFARDNALIDLVALCSEIYSVALYYLGDVDEDVSGSEK